ncbi:MAG: prolyl oligopeptidase family serine peptidase [Clostridia bacterium]|nr:prolyl oligopeptidase family serine peptidase [Clostridia bacterium]
MINYENLRSFAYCNDRLVRGAPRGIVLSFGGLGFSEMYGEDTAEGKYFAGRNIIFAVPYLDPWAWMNRAAVLTTDRIVGALTAKYGELPVVSSGGSMGGQSALVYTRYAARTPAACVVNCPVCDMEYHLTERPDLPRTMFAAFSSPRPFDEELRSRSPLRLVNELPRVPYTVFHCDCDAAVNIDAHSRRFVAEMERAGHDVTFLTVPGRDHCDLPPEYLGWYRVAIEIGIK